MEILRFIFQDIWHFIGTILLIEAIMYPIYIIVNNIVKVIGKK